MSDVTYAKPVIDRTLSDVAAKNSRAFFNIVDWVRVYQNSIFIHVFVEFFKSTDLSFIAVATPVITTIPSNAQLNNLLTNIENARVAAGFPAVPGLSALNTAWGEGTGADSPDYIDANAWESTMELVRAYLVYSSEDTVRCGVAQSGMDRVYQVMFRTHPYAIQDTDLLESPVTGIAPCGASFKRGRKFRTYVGVRFARSGLSRCGSSTLVQSYFRRY